MSDDQLWPVDPNPLLKAIFHTIDDVRHALDIAEEQRDASSYDQLLGVLFELADIVDRRFPPGSIKNIRQAHAKRSGNGENNFG
jgi:hypothetical protein